MALASPTLTRDQVATRLKCSHAELGRLLRERRAPLPVRVDGNIMFYADEVAAAEPAVQKVLAFRRNK